MEHEMKIALDAGSVAQLKKLTALREHSVSKPRDEEHVDRYFDTGGFDLRKHGFAQQLQADLLQYQHEVEVELEVDTSGQVLKLVQVQAQRGLPRAGIRLTGPAR